MKMKPIDFINIDIIAGQQVIWLSDTNTLEDYIHVLKKCLAREFIPTGLIDSGFFCAYQFLFEEAFKHLTEEEQNKALFHLDVLSPKTGGRQ